MRKKNKWIVWVACVCILWGMCGTGCTSSKEEAYSRSLFIYMCGSTLEASKGWGTQNIAEMLSAKIPKDTCVIIETGGCRTWRDYDISKTELSRYQIKNGKLKLLETKPSASMGDPETLTDFLEYCMEHYASDQMGVIFWDHGTGSNGGVCYDTLYENDYLSLPELDEAFATLDAQDVHFDLVGLDACLMANYDTAAIFAKYADHMIASEEMEPAGGWDYSYVCKNYGEEEFYTGVLDAYADKCMASEKNYYTLSHIDLTEFAQVETSFSEFCKGELSENANRRLQIVTNYADDTLSFGANSSMEGYSDLYDLAMFAENNGNINLPEDVRSIVTSVNGETREEACGLSFFYPLNDPSRVKDYVSHSSSEAYKTYLSDYYLGKEEEVNAIVFTDRGSDRDGELAFTLSADSLKNVRCVDYKLYFVTFDEETDENLAYCFGYDSDLTSEVEGEYVTSFKGRWVAWNGAFLSSELVGIQDDYAIYASPIKCNGVTGTIRFTYRKKDGEFQLLGFVPQDETGEQGRIETIEPGDEITILREMRDSNFDKSLEETESFKYGEDVEFSVETLPDGYYQFYGVVTDLYGNEYYSDVMISENKDGKLTCYLINHDQDGSVGL